MLHQFTHNGLTFGIALSEGQTPEQAQHEHLLRVDPSYQWLSFRRALIASPEYPSALAIACSSAALSTAFQVLNSAIDFCCQGGIEDQEVEAFQSAIALYLSSLPDTEIGQSISARITTLCGDYHIPLTP